MSRSNQRSHHDRKHRRNHREQHLEPHARSRMLAGNRRFAEGKAEHPWQDKETRESLIDTQNPDAVVLGCSDSRVPPEIIFDAGLGDMFTVRTAGQMIDPAVLQSLEYAVTGLHVSLLVVVPPEIIFDAGLGDMFTVRTAGQMIDPAVLQSLEYAVTGLHVSLLVVLGHQHCAAVQKGAEELETLITKLQDESQGGTPMTREQLMESLDDVIMASDSSSPSCKTNRKAAHR